MSGIIYVSCNDVLLDWLDLSSIYDDLGISLDDFKFDLSCCFNGFMLINGEKFVCKDDSKLYNIVDKII